MELFLIDAIGPFFRDFDEQRINWSKIPFTHLATEGPERRVQWDGIQQDLRHFAAEIRKLGYNAVTLDDLAHLAPHPLHEPEIRDRIAVFREEFALLFEILRVEFSLKIFLTTDVIPVTPAIDASLKKTDALENYYRDLVRGVLDDFPQLEGLILRIGESDGTDVRDPIRTRLHLRNARETNRFLKALLPEFESRSKKLILRTWTVGAHRIGDLIWHNKRLDLAFEGIDSPAFIVSMKHGESDFFRYLPLNRAFFRVTQPKIIELQARREYEGAGEFPSFIGRDCERFARELESARNVIGMSVWCQTGGWHRFRRLAFLENSGDDSWIRLNAATAIDIFKNKQSVEDAVRNFAVPDRAVATLELLNDADTVLNEIYYLEDFARQKLFFRRVRIPPLLHVYWDQLFINHAVAKILRHFVRDPERALRAGEAAILLFPKMIELAREAALPVDDIEHMRDFFGLILLARRYYLIESDPALVAEIRAAKKAYKQRWPRAIRRRYRVKTSFDPPKFTPRTVSIAARFLLRNKRGYRLIDHLFTLNLLGFIYRIFKPRNKRSMPKILRKTAMGVDVLFK